MANHHLEVSEVLELLSTALELAHEFMGYIRYSCHIYGFRSNSGLRNVRNRRSLVKKMHFSF